MKLIESRQKTRDGYTNTLVYCISYKKGETVTEFYPGTVYHLRRRAFKVEVSQITGEDFLVARKDLSWTFTYETCPTCFSRMCESFITKGFHSWYRS